LVAAEDNDVEDSIPLIVIGDKEGTVEVAGIKLEKFVLDAEKRPNEFDARPPQECLKLLL
jgi:hypothetical protein